jgi:O-antigen/teichoic acid export membrane protein
MRGTIGATIGLIITLELAWDYLDDEGSRWILALGMLAIGLVGLVVVAVTRDEGGLRIGPLVTNLIFILIALLLFTGDEEKTSRIELIGVILIILGVLLCAYAYLLYRGTGKEDAPTEAGPTPSTPTATA